MSALLWTFGMHLSQLRRGFGCWILGSPQGHRLDPFTFSETKPEMRPTQYYAVEI